MKVRSYQLKTTSYSKLVDIFQLLLLKWIKFTYVDAKIIHSVFYTYHKRQKVHKRKASRVFDELLTNEFEDGRKHYFESTDDTLNGELAT